MTTPNPFDKPESTPSISFALTDQFGNKTSVPVGTTFGGKVTKAPEVVQSIGYPGTPFAGRPLFWDNDGKGKKTDKPTSADGRANKAVQQIVTILNVDGVDKGLWTPFYPKSQYEAIQAATKGADGKPRAIEPGDELYITLSGFERSEDSNKAASKLYSARFVKGAGAFAPDPTSAPSAAPAPPVAAPPAASAEPVLSNGFTASTLRAGGWSEAQIAALSAPQTVPAPHDAPAVAVAPAGDDARAARLASMSAEDRALLNL